MNLTLSTSLKPALGRTLFLLVLFWISSNQELFVLRYGPALNLFATGAVQVFSRWRWKKNPTPTSSSAVSGIIEGVKHTAFIWSLVRLKPSAAMALHLSSPVISTILSNGKWTDSIILFVLATIVALTAPIHPVFLFLGVLAVCLDVYTRRTPPSATPSKSPPSSTISLLILFLTSFLTSILISQFLGSQIVGIVRISGDRWWIYVLLLTCLLSATCAYADFTGPLRNGSWELLTGCGVMVISVFIPGMGDRLRWLEIAAFALLGAAAWKKGQNDEEQDHKGGRMNGNVVSNVGDVVEEEEMTGLHSSLPKQASTTSPIPPIAPTHILLTLLPILFPLTLFFGYQYRHITTFYAPHVPPTTPTQMPHTHFSPSSPLSPSSPPPDIELAISYYSESTPDLTFVISQFRSSFPEYRTGVTVYHKGLELNDTALIEWIGRPEIRGMVDKVVGRTNVGRDGGTHLWHIIDNYDQLASFTLFMQGHAPWEYEYQPRLHLINERTGFVSLGHYLTVTNNYDDLGNGGSYSRISYIWNLVHPSRPYPSTPHLASYHGEFGASRARIRATPKEVYKTIQETLEAPEGDPIYSEDGSWGWNGTPNGPENPFVGHSLERAWAFMFNCVDPTISYKCGMQGRESRSCVCEDAPGGGLGS